MNRQTTGSVMTRMLCALAMLLSGFIGQAAAQHGGEWRSPQYRLPDGTYAALCQPGEARGNREGSPAPVSAHHCGACIVVAGQAFTPPPHAGLALPILGSGDRLAPVAGELVRRILSHHARSRGPPLAA